MKVSFLGDSITEGCGASEFGKGYVEVLGKRMCIEVNNYGIGGTRIAKQKKLTHPHAFDMYFKSRVDFIDKSSDFVFVFGGTNDYGHGDADFGQETDRTDNTFCGALNLLTDNLLLKFDKDKLCFILPCRRYEDERTNMHGKTLKDYVDAIRDIVTKKGIDYIDLYNQFFPQPVTNQGDMYTVDGLHPNDYGHKCLAEVLEKYLKEKQKELFSAIAEKCSECF